MGSGCNSGGFFNSNFLGMVLVFVLILVIFPLFFID